MRKMNRIILSLLMMPLCAAVMAGTITINPNTADTQVNSLGTVSWAGGTAPRVGTDSGTGTLTGYVMPFQMTTLPDGESITAASLTFNCNAFYNLTTVHGNEPNVDLVGIRVSSSPTVSASDLSGTVIADSFISPINSTLSGINSVSNETIATWLASNWTPGSYIFLTLVTDAGNPNNSEFITVNSADSGANAPVLTITTEADTVIVTNTFTAANADYSGNSAYGANRTIIGNGTSGTNMLWVGGTELAAGNGNNSEGVLVFVLPELPAGGILTNANLTVDAYRSWENTWNIDLYGIRSSASSSDVSTNDYGAYGNSASGTKIADNWLTPSDVNITWFSRSTDDTADANLTSWLTTQYAAVGAGGYVFLRFQPDSSAAISDVSAYKVAGSKHTTRAIPQLTLTVLSETNGTAKSDQTISFANPGNQLTTNTVALSATATSGLTVSFGVVSGPATLNGSSVTFTGSGSVTLSASQSGNDNWNPAPTTNVTFSVSKATATVSLSNTNQTYDGYPKTATASTVPSGLSVDITYDGSATAPIRSGNYAISATVNDTMYQGSAAGTLTITAVPKDVTCYGIFKNCNVYTNGNISSPTDALRVGRDSLLVGSILVFELPDLKGAAITSANLKFTVNSAAWMSTTYHANLNVDALRSAVAGTAVAASDFSQLGISAPAINIQSNAVNWTNSFPYDFETDGSADSNLGDWLAEQYDTVGAGGWVYLRLAPDQNPGINSRYMDVDGLSVRLTITTDGNEDPVRGNSNSVSVKMGTHAFRWDFDRSVEWGYFLDGQPWVVAPASGSLYLTNATPSRKNNQTVYIYPSTNTSPNPVTGDIHITVLNPPLDNLYDEGGYLLDPNGVWGWDGRPVDGYPVTDPKYNSALGWDGVTPLLLEAGDSVTTPESITNVVMSDRSVELEALAVLTVLDQIPPADAFRPGIFREGTNRTNPEILCYSDLIDLSGKLIASPVGTNGLDGSTVTKIAQEFSPGWLTKLLPGPGFINTGLSYTEGCSAFYNNGSWVSVNETAGTSYGARIGQQIGWLAVGSLADWLTEDERKICRIRLIQRAIDTYSAVNEGLCLEEGAGVLPGYSTLITLAGELLDHQGMKDVNNGVNGVPPWFIFADFATTLHTDGVAASELADGEQSGDRLIPLHPGAGDPCPGLNKTNQVGCVASTTANTMTMQDDFYWDYSRPQYNCINLKFKVTAGPGSGNTIYVITAASGFLNTNGQPSGINVSGYEYGGTVTVKPSWAAGNGTPPTSASTLAFSITTDMAGDPASHNARWIWTVNGIVDTGYDPHIEKERCVCTSPIHEYASIMAGGTIGQLIALYALDAQGLYKGGLDKWLIDTGTRPGYGEVLFDGAYMAAVQNEFLGALWKQNVLNDSAVNTNFVYTGSGAAALSVPSTSAKMWYE